MKRSLQLRIPTPCHEDWTHMQPTEKGRHCESCCKTVVDFTAMSDAEILRYLSHAGPHVCGRLMPDQLGRRLAPAPVQKNGRSGWAWVLAALMMAKGSDDRRPVKAGNVEMRVPAQQGDSIVEERTMGIMMYVTPRVVDSPVVEVPAIVDSPIGWLEARGILPDKGRALMGKTALVGKPALVGDIEIVPVRDTIQNDYLQPPGDTLPAVSRGMTAGGALEGMVGGLSVGVPVRRTADILIDTVKQLAEDTMAVLGWRPSPDLNIYPNPVPRGCTIQLAWKAQPGQYQIALLNTRGQLIAERVLDISGAGQVDSWVMPASLAAGIYMLRVARSGGIRPFTCELVVR